MAARDVLETYQALWLWFTDASEWGIWDYWSLHTPFGHTHAVANRWAINEMSKQAPTTNWPNSVGSCGCRLHTKIHDNVNGHTKKMLAAWNALSGACKCLCKWARHTYSSQKQHETAKKNEQPALAMQRAEQLQQRESSKAPAIGNLMHSRIIPWEGTGWWMPKCNPVSASMVESYTYKSIT